MDPYQETQATYDYLATELDRLGLLYLHLVEPAAREHEEGRQLLKKIRTNFSNFLIVNGGYTSRQAAKVVEEGSADMVAFGRPFISNPDFPDRIRQDLPLTEANPEDRKRTRLNSSH